MTGDEGGIDSWQFYDFWRLYHLNRAYKAGAVLACRVID